jgi:hypothetical protein
MTLFCILYEFTVSCFSDYGQVVTISNYNTVADFHFTDHSTLISVYFH